MGIGFLRMIVAFYRGFSYDLAAGIFVTERMAELLKQQPSIISEQLSYLRSIQSLFF